MPKLEIEKIKIMNGTGNVKAMATVLIGDIKIYGVKVVEGPTGLFVALPERKGSDGKYWRIVSVEGKDNFDAMRTAVLEAYSQASVGGEVNPDDVPF